jgi:hypothetical protein
MLASGPAAFLVDVDAASAPECMMMTIACKKSSQQQSRESNISMLA